MVCPLLCSNRTPTGSAVGVPVLYVRVESSRSAGRTLGEHLRNCSGAVGEMHTSPQAPWNLRYPHSGAGCTETIQKTQVF